MGDEYLRASEGGSWKSKEEGSRMNEIASSWKLFVFSCFYVCMCVCVWNWPASSRIAVERTSLTYLRPSWPFLLPIDSSSNSLFVFYFSFFFLFFASPSFGWCRKSICRRQSGLPVRPVLFPVYVKFFSFSLAAHRHTEDVYNVSVMNLLHSLDLSGVVLIKLPMSSPCRYLHQFQSPLE